MPENISSSSFANKKELFLRIKKEREILNKDKIIPRDRKDMIPVSYMQEKMLIPEIKGLYDPEEYRPIGPSLGYIIKGRINILALRKAIQEIVRRHEVLRTNYKVMDKQPYQQINELPDNILNVVDLDNLTEDENKNEANRLLRNKGSDKFSYFQDLFMITATLITAKDEHMLIIVTSHIATDAFSMHILQKELLIFYQSFLYNIPSPFPELPVQYADFSIWERERFSGDFLKEKLAYWKQLPDANNSVLPTDYIMSEPACYDGDSVPVVILPEMTRKLKLLSQKSNVTLFTFLFAALIALIYRFSGYNYNLFSMVVANRAKKETDSLIGCFMDFQFVHIDLKDDLNFLEVIERTKKTLFDVYENYVPCNLILNNISHLVDFNFLPSEGVIKNTASNSNVDAADSSSQDNNSKPNSKINDTLSMSQRMMFIPLKIPQPGFAIFPIALNLSEISDTINGFIRYRTAQYNRATIVNLANDYIILLSHVVNNPEIRISEIKTKPHKSVA